MNIILRTLVLFALLGCACQPRATVQLQCPASVSSYAPFLVEFPLLDWSESGRVIEGRGNGWLFKGQQDSSSQLIEFVLEKNGRLVSEGKFSGLGDGKIENYSIIQLPDRTSEWRLYETVVFQPEENPMSVIEAGELGVRIESEFDWNGGVLQRREWSVYSDRDVSMDAKSLAIEVPDSWIGGSQVEVQIWAANEHLEQLVVEFNGSARLEFHGLQIVGKGVIKMMRTEEEREWSEREFSFDSAAQAVVVEWDDK